MIGRRNDLGVLLNHRIKRPDLWLAATGAGNTVSDFDHAFVTKPTPTGLADSYGWRFVVGVTVHFLG